MKVICIYMLHHDSLDTVASASYVLASGLIENFWPRPHPSLASLTSLVWITQILPCKYTIGLPACRPTYNVAYRVDYG